jgi:hypothetical protein
VEADRKANEHNWQTGRGPRLDALLDAIKAADATPKAAKSADTDADKLKDGKAVRDTVNIARSRGRTLAARILGVAFAANNGEPEAFATVHAFEDMITSYGRHRDRLYPDVKMFLDTIFRNQDADAFDVWLSENVIDENSPAFEQKQV